MYILYFTCGIILYEKTRIHTHIINMLYIYIYIYKGPLASHTAAGTHFCSHKQFVEYVHIYIYMCGNLWKDDLGIIHTT